MSTAGDVMTLTWGTLPKTPLSRKKISIVVPARNEQDMLPHVYEEVTRVMSSLSYDYEVLVVDNGSHDQTESIVEQYCNEDDRWKYIRFSRNFNIEASLAAGMRYASGDAVVFLFSDLQDPPDKIPDLIEKWEQGHDVVYGVRRKRPGDPRWRNFSVFLFYRLINSLSDIQLPVDAGDFRLISRRVVDVLNRMDERGRYLRGLVQWVGFKRCPIYYERRPRLKGKSKAPLWFVVSFALTAITSFSIKPLRLFSLVGASALLAAIILATIYFLAWLWDGIPVRGATTTYLLLLINLGVISLGLGVLGEYLGRIFDETKRRPMWIVERTVNLSNVSSTPDVAHFEQVTAQA